MKAILRNIRMSSKKVNLVAGLIRRKPVAEALAILKFLPKKAARPLLQVIQSAAANATQNFKQKQETLVVEKIVVNEGATLKRFRPVSRGRAHPINKRMCHLRVELAVKVEKPATEKKTKLEKTHKKE